METSLTPVMLIEFVLFLASMSHSLSHQPLIVVGCGAKGYFLLLLLLECAVEQHPLVSRTHLFVLF